MNCDQYEIFAHDLHEFSMMIVNVVYFEMKLIFIITLSKNNLHEAEQILFILKQNNESTSYEEMNSSLRYYLDIKKIMQ